MKKEIRERIVDYPTYEREIEKWLRVKGDEKYSQFADILDDNGIEITWVKVSDLYRYDKRLLINNFRYISFFEEYLRAILMNNSNDDLSNYDNLKEEYFPAIMKKVAKLEEGTLKEYFDVVDIENNVQTMTDLRNWVSHNKIILQLDNPRRMMKTFYDLLPQNYREGYRKDINRCVCGLEIDSNISITI